MTQVLAFLVVFLLQLTQFVVAVPSAPLTVDSLNTSVRSTCRKADCPSGYRLRADWASLERYCFRDQDSYNAASRRAHCPSGYTYTGLTCYRGPHSYTKCCTTVWNKCRCRSGYTNMGCHCQRWAKSLPSKYMSCDSGYFLNEEIGRCYKKCKSGYTNKGEYCNRPTSSVAFSCKYLEIRKKNGQCCT